ncbi:MAG TPA: type II secretion system F family protein [Ktedonobacterales bacterium]|jgi:tight adherence protein B|nr:type II secretion system F family protein [Ktedonobacterales bacterium]
MSIFLTTSAQAPMALAALITTQAMIIGGLVAGGVILFFLGVQRVVDARSNVVSRRMKEMGIIGVAPEIAQPRGKRGRGRRGRGAQASGLLNNQSNYTVRLASELAQADLKITAGEFMTLRGVLASVGALLGLVIPVGNPLVLALVLLLAGLYGPTFWVRRRKIARQRKFNEQLPDLVTLMAGSLRTGYAFMQSLELVAREGAEPARTEFQRVVREVGLGIPPEEALGHLVERMQSEDLNLLVTAVNVQREVGGNLVEVLEIIATTIRERIKLLGEVGVLTAQQQLSGYIIAFLPVGLGLLLFIINPTYMLGMFTTTHWFGWTIVSCSSIMVIIGLVVIRRIVDIKV